MSFLDLFSGHADQYATARPRYPAALFDAVAAASAAQNALLWNGYRDVPRPAGFEPVTLPPLAIEVDWNLPQLLAYVLTWSASQRCLAAEGRGWFERAEVDLTLNWGNAEAPRRVSMPLLTFGGRFDDPC